MEGAAYIALGIFMAGVVFGAGALTSRVADHARRIENLEKTIRDGFEELKALIRGEGASL